MFSPIGAAGLRACIIGCGYVGTALAKFWQGKHQLTVTTRSKKRLPELAEFPVFLLDRNFSDLLKQQQIVVISVAPDTRDVEAYRKTYVETAWEISKAIEQNTQVIYLSSTSVYGEKQGALVDEETPLAPANPQAAILCEAEAIVRKMPTACLFRLGEIYGPGREFRLTSTTPFPGTGGNFINIVHRDLIVSAIDFAVERSLSGTFNLCEDLHPTRKAFYDALCEQAGLPKVSWDPSRPSLHGGNKRVSCEKLKALGFN